MKSFTLFLVTLLIVSRAAASVVVPVGTSSQVLISAAGSTQGANGTFFRSDISIINFGTNDASVAIQWLPQAGTGSGSTSIVTVKASTGIRSSDFVSEVLHQSGLGSIIVKAQGPGGTVDTTAQLFVSARIWTQQPGTSGGTTSQSFPAIPVNTVNTPIAAFFGISSADNPANFRVNVGVVNLDPNFTQTFFITIPSIVGVPVGQTVTLPPMTMTQVSMGNGVASTSQIQIQNSTTGSSRSNFWTAYASTVDNITGDAWSELPVTGTP